MRWWWVCLVACGGTGDDGVAHDAPLDTPPFDVHEGGPLLAVDAQHEAFGTVSTACLSTPRVLTVTNQGTVATSPITVALAGAHADAFTIPVASDTCSGARLDAFATCELSIAFTPLYAPTAGAKTASIEVAAEGTSVSVALDATASDVAPLQVAPTALAFGPIAVGKTTAFQHVTISNVACPNFGQVAFFLDTAGRFDFDFASDCQTALADGASCTASVEFEPETAGSVTASLSIKSAVGSSATIAITGSTP